MSTVHVHKKNPPKMRSPYIFFVDASTKNRNTKRLLSREKGRCSRAEWMKMHSCNTKYSERNPSFSGLFSYYWLRQPASSVGACGQRWRKEDTYMAFGFPLVFTCSRDSGTYQIGQPMGLIQHVGRRFFRCCRAHRIAHAHEQ